MTKQPTQLERLAVLETKVDTLLSTSEKTLTALEEIKNTMPTYATKDYVDKQIKAVRRSKWVQNTLSAILGVILTLLIQDYFRG